MDADVDYEKKLSHCPVIMLIDNVSNDTGIAGVK